MPAPALAGGRGGWLRLAFLFHKGGARALRAPIARRQGKDGANTRVALIALWNGRAPNARRQHAPKALHPPGRAGLDRGGALVAGRG
jgi:hypothetical protein